MSTSSRKFTCAYEMMIIIIINVVIIIMNLFAFKTCFWIDPSLNVNFYTWPKIWTKNKQLALVPPWIHCSHNHNCYFNINYKEWCSLTLTPFKATAKKILENVVCSYACTSGPGLKFCINFIFYLEKENQFLRKEWILLSIYYKKDKIFLNIIYILFIHFLIEMNLDEMEMESDLFYKTMASF